MTILPSRRTEFTHLFPRFLDEFLNADVGNQHCRVYRESAAKARENYERVCAKADRGEDYTDDLLRTFLPHGDCTYTRETDAWLHVAPALQGAVQKKFEGAGWTRPEDWPQVAASILDLVRTGVERPEEFADACRTFADAPHSNGLQAAFISPILNALRPDLYSIVNYKPRVVAAWLLDETMSNRNLISQYPEVNRTLRALVDELSEVIEPHTRDGIDRYQVFDFFTHWMVSVEKYEFEGKKPGDGGASARAMSGDAARIIEIMSDIESLRPLLKLFGEAILCAADPNNSTWHISLRKKYGADSSFIEPDFRDPDGRPLPTSSPYQVRLVAGSYLFATFHGDGFIAWVPRESLTEEMVARVVEEGGVLRELDFKSIPETPVSLRITCNLIAWYREEIQPLHFAYIRKVAAISKKTPWAEHHRADAVEFINQETGLDIPQPDYYRAVRPVHYWWLNVNPSVWSVDSLEAGDEQTYTARNENGNKRRIYRHMQEVRPGDLVIGYETTPRKEVRSILEITRPLTPTDDNEEFAFRKLCDVPRPVSFETIQSLPELSSSEPITNNQGSLFALSADEFATVAELSGVDIEAIGEVADVAFDDGSLARRIREAIDDPIAVRSFETRREFEDLARRMLDEKLGRMSSDDIREFLDLLVTSRRDGNTLIKSRFGMALTGSLAQSMASDPEAFNRWVGVLWESDPESGLKNFELFRRSGEVKGAGVSLPSFVLYLKDPERYGIAIGVMIRALKEFGYDVPKKIESSQEYGQYLAALHAFRKSYELDPGTMDYVLWKLMEEPREHSGKSRGPSVPYSLSYVAAETNIPESTLEQWIAAIERKGQAILYGPPGTGKTYVAKRLARFLSESGGGGLVQTIQFHPAYGYEDFIRGIRPRTDEETEELRYEYVSGAFMSFCEKAEQMGEETRGVMIIDEINRADLARVFGELMYLLEYREEKVRIAGGKEFAIPLNVRIIGTMNTADRSIALVDHALRRRFAFLELKPDYDLLGRYHARHETGFDASGLVEILKRINTAIADPHYAIGISYFLDRQIRETIEQVWKTEIEPYLVEHFFDQPTMMEGFRWERIEGTVDRAP